jgi:hypothetical protein
MKTLCLTTLTAVFLLICTDGLQAQSTQPKPNQVELMKQLIGSWKADFAKDTTVFWEAKPFGTGLECYYKSITKEKILMEGKQLFGYDKKIDKYVAVNLVKGMDIEIWALWFTSSNKYIITYYSDISNPDKSSFKVDGEFISPNGYNETFIINGKPVITYKYTRVKK